MLVLNKINGGYVDEYTTVSLLHFDDGLRDVVGIRGHSFSYDKLFSYSLYIFIFALF